MMKKTFAVILILSCLIVFFDSSMVAFADPAYEADYELNYYPGAPGNVNKLNVTVHFYMYENRSFYYNYCHTFNKASNSNAIMCVNAYYVSQSGIVSDYLHDEKQYDSTFWTHQIDLIKTVNNSKIYSIVPANTYIYVNLKAQNYGAGYLSIEGQVFDL